ncbi:iron-hydroxamate ABC transporter substrate-binding protein [Bacillus horti]|uniref:Iron complex transport system substrate-binding protein n=1 Tax=Caldalkalibacillus horti TaxID=77523 RepID=A0ABT9W6R7_9BACI|nr:iron-hydroxamate ABC transporter substrate-binding protein [Bacillus horti]MDQ0168540.1 iron complex transport system substrate-binding protein [Bacillus horti]
MYKPISTMDKDHNQGGVKRLGILFVGLLSLMLILSACASSDNSSDAGTEEPISSSPSEEEQQANEETEEETAQEITVEDALGNEVTIPANPQRIIASYLEDHLVTLGVTPAAQWSISRGVQDYLEDYLKDVPTVGFDLPVEEVMSFDPDLLIIGTESAVEGGLYEQYSKIAPTYVLGSELDDDWRAALVRIGELLGKTDEAEQALADYEQKAEETKNKLNEAIGQQSIAILWLVNKQFFIVGEGVSSGSVVYQDLGMIPPNLVNEIPTDARANWNPVSLEMLAELDADHIFLVNSDKESGSEALDEPIWSNIPAVQAGSVHEIESTKSWLYKGFIAGTQIMDDVLEALVQE